MQSQKQKAHPQTTQSPPFQDGSDTAPISSLDVQVKGTQQDHAIVGERDGTKFNTQDLAAAQNERVVQEQQGSNDINRKREKDSIKKKRKREKDSLPISESAESMSAEFYRSLHAGKIDALKRMLEDEEDCLLDQRTPQLNTPLHIAAGRGLDELIKRFLTRRHSLLTQRNVHGELALHLAAAAGHLAAVESIVGFVGEAEKGDVYKVGNRDGDTCLHLAVRELKRKERAQKHKEVALFLIDVCPEASYCLNRDSMSPLYEAAELGDLELVRAMIDQVQVKDDVQCALEKGKSVLLAAINGGNLGVLKAILSNSSEISCGNGVSPLSRAAYKGNLQMVQYLLTKFPDCNYKRDKAGTFPIHLAALRGHLMVVEEVLRFHPDSRELLTSRGKNILHLAAAHGKQYMVRYILSKPDFDDLINARDDSGKTPLHCAVAAKDPKVVDLLIWDKRVKLDLVNNEGDTARDMAFNYGNPPLLLKERLIWAVLEFAGAPRKSFKTANKSKEQYTEMNLVGPLMVVATLVVTITFTASFTIPGGISDSDTNLGMANFLKRRIFQLFVISNSIALYTALLDLLVLLCALTRDVQSVYISLKFAIPLLAISFATMSISFMLALYLVVSALQWLGIAIWLLGIIFLAAALTIFVLAHPPNPKSQLGRRIINLPFRAVLYFFEANL